MNWMMRLGIFVTFIIVFILVIAFARGYRIDFSKKSVTSTGIIAVSAYPKAAKVYINGELKGVTDINLSLPYGKYEVAVKKEGYTTWSKKISLKGELVESIDVLLFPINPSLTPLTNLGVVKAIPLDQGDKVLLFSQNGSEADGIYLFDPNNRPISFLPPLKLIVAKVKLPTEIDFIKATVDFSPDAKQVIVQFDNGSIYLLALDEENKEPSFITAESKNNLLAAWAEEKNLEIAKIIEAFPKDLRKIASDSFHIISFSPDKTKFLYQPENEIILPQIIKPALIATNQTPEERNLDKDNLYVYDLKEDKNFMIIYNPKSLVPNPYFWYPDSKHLVINEESKIAVVDYDNTNKQIVYSGPFEKEFLTVTYDGKLVILTNLNSQLNKFPDVYAVGIK